MVERAPLLWTRICINVDEVSGLTDELCIKRGSPDQHRTTGDHWILILLFIYEGRVVFDDLFPYSIEFI